MASAEDIKRLFIKTLDGQDVKYDDVSDSDTQVVRVGWHTKAYDSLGIYFFFDEDGTSAHIQATIPISIPEDRLPNMLMAINSANRSYRWIDFYLDEDGDVTGEMDAVLDTATAGDELFELMIRFVDICNDVNPTFMRAIWA